jgi:D-glycero-D-manno-heptose 1,7-bisphosphate phosphatase
MSETDAAGATEPRPAAFLDRDGTLMEDSGFIDDPRRVRVLEGVALALRALAQAGFETIVVTNQPGATPDETGEPDVERVHRTLASLLAEEGASIDAFYYCGHGGECDCRKPLPGMIRRAVAERHIDLERSVVFGDGEADMKLAERVGIPGVLVNARLYAGPEPLYRARTLLEGVVFFLDYAARTTA